MTLIFRFMRSGCGIEYFFMKPVEEQKIKSKAFPSGLNGKKEGAYERKESN